MTKKQKITTKDWTYIGEVKNGKPHGKGTQTTRMEASMQDNGKMVKNMVKDNFMIPKASQKQVNLLTAFLKKEN